MIYVVKLLVSAALIVVVSEISKKWPTLGGLIASLPLVSILGMIWLWRDSHDPELLAQHALGTFWFVLPSLPMFIVIPWLLRKGLGFGVSLSMGCVLTLVLYAATAFALKRFGVAV